MAVALGIAGGAVGVVDPLPAPDTDVAVAGTARVAAAARAVTVPSTALAMTVLSARAVANSFPTAAAVAVPESVLAAGEDAATLGDGDGATVWEGI